MGAFRADVYDAIDEEREYQEERWPGHAHSNTEFLVYIDHYVKKGFFAASTLDGGDYGTETKDNLRKIAALAVAAMEQNGLVRRNS